MTRLKDLTGMRFGRLTVLHRVQQTSKTKNARWLCKCDCGNLHAASSSPLLSGKINSCKCLAKELSNQRFTTHGKSRSPEWNTWAGIKTRCYNKNDTAYAFYGARGIAVCDEWRTSFDAFLRDMGPRPSPRHSIDRINVNGDYEPSNCRWATKDIQANNTRSNHPVEINGETKTVSQWIVHFGLNRSTVYKRIATGAPVDLWFSSPASNKSHTKQSTPSSAVEPYKNRPR